MAEDLVADLVKYDPADSAHDAAVDSESDDVSRIDRDDESPIVYGDNAYGTGPFQERLEDADIESRCKTQQPTAPGGLFTKERFDVNLDDEAVTCPAGVTVKIRRGTSGFGHGLLWCFVHDLRGPAEHKCTTSTSGRTIGISAHEAALARARRRPGRPGLERRLPVHASEGRTKDRPPHASAPRWTTSESTRHRQGER